MRLLIPTPRADETVTSILDRAATAYATTREALADELVLSAGGDPDVLKHIDLDVSPPAALIGALAEALGCTAYALNRLRLPKCAWLLRPTRRTAYCPECIYEDLTATGSCYLRREWSFSFITHCRRHRRTLVGPLALKWNPRRVSATRDLTPLPVRKRVLYTDVFVGDDRRLRWSAQEQWDPLKPLGLRAVWTRLCKFEDSLLAACVGRGRGFKVRCAFYRDLVMLFSANWDDVAWVPAMVHLRPYYLTDDLGIFVLPKNSMPDYDVHKVWEQFLGRSEPSWRRFVTWVLMQCGSVTGPVCIGAIKGRVSVRSTVSARMPVRRWVETCLDVLPEYGRSLARAMAVRWPLPYRRAVFQIQAQSMHLNVETLNTLRVEMREKFMRSLVERVNAADRKELSAVTVESLWRSSSRALVTRPLPV